jgi:hypothetical protein
MHWLDWAGGYPDSWHSINPAHVFEVASTTLAFESADWTKSTLTEVKSPSLLSTPSLKITGKERRRKDKFTPSSSAGIPPSPFSCPLDHRVSGSQASDSRPDTSFHISQFPAFSLGSWLFSFRQHPMGLQLHDHVSQFPKEICVCVCVFCCSAFQRTPTKQIQDVKL